MSQLNFDAGTVAPSTGQTGPIPAGWYNVMITESELRTAKNNAQNQYLNLCFKVIEGQHAGRQVYTNLNLINSNAQAQAIAYSDLSAICHAINVIQVNDSQQLHGHPLKIRVKVTPPKDGFDASNDVTAYRNVNEQVGDAGAAATPAAPAAPAGFGPPAAAPAIAGAAALPPAAAAPAGFPPPAAAPPVAQAPVAAAAPANLAAQPWAQPGAVGAPPAAGPAAAAPPPPAAPVGAPPAAAPAPGQAPPWAQQQG